MSRPRRPQRGWTLGTVQRLAAQQGFCVERLVLCRGNVKRYALFRAGSLRHALDATFFPRLRDVAAAVEPIG